MIWKRDAVSRPAFGAEEEEQTVSTPQIIFQLKQN
jgi:hypothetical protein